MQKIYQRQQARRDLVEYFVYLADNASLTIAERFLTSSETSFKELALNPLIGSPLTLRNPRLAGMRKWHIKDFDNMLIFYIPRHDGVSIVRVIHAAQDWWGLLGLV
jgi:toxin ParE1/3/4